MIPAPGHSRPLTVEGLGLPAEAVVRLAGSLFVLGRTLTVRVETIEIEHASRGRTSLLSMVDRLRKLAELAGTRRLVIEGISVGNTELTKILVRHYGATVTPMKPVVMTLPVT
jgi:hypothetical protein